MLPREANHIVATQNHRLNHDNTHKKISILYREIAAVRDCIMDIGDPGCMLRCSLHRERQLFSQARSSSLIINLLDSKEASIAARHYHILCLAFYTLPCCWNPRLYSVNPVYEPQEQSYQYLGRCHFYGSSPGMPKLGKMDEVFRNFFTGYFYSLHYNYVLLDSYLV